MSTTGGGTYGRRRTVDSHRVLHYVMFNEGWDLVAGNRINQMTNPMRADEPEQAVEKYLLYLVHSLDSFARHHAAAPIPVDIRLVEVSQDGLDVDTLRYSIGSRFPEIDLTVTPLPYADIADFVDEAVRIPVHLYRSPNRLHEAVCFRILAESTSDLIAIVDPDVTFLKDGALDDLWNALLAHDDRWAAAFIEAGKRTPHGGAWIESRERMHSVAVFFKVAEMRRHVAFQAFLHPTSLEERLSGVQDPSARNHYRNRLDTFNILTDLLRSSYSCDRLLNLNACTGRFREGQMLTLICDQLVHSKYMDRTARFALEEALQLAGIDIARCSPEITDLLRLARGD